MLVFSLLIIYTLVVQAANKQDIIFPVAELGNCKNEAECKTYCDQPKNLNSCLDFAEKYNLIPEKELAQARKFAAVGVGPGGCASKDSCETYCDDISHMNECLAFAEEHNLIPPDELEEAKKVQAALARGATLPGGCRNKQECETYCENPDRMEECINFAETAGFISPEELKDAKKAMQAIKKGAKPPPCRGKRACDDYCGKPENFEQCITFAEAAGFMDAEEAKMVRKTGGKGPGNCQDKKECKVFCQNPNNQQVCFNFAKEHDLLSEEDLEMMEQGKQRMLEAFEMASPEILQCIDEKLGIGFVEKMQNEQEVMLNPEMGNVMKDCFEKIMIPKEDMMPPENFINQPGVMPPEQIQQYSQQQYPEGREFKDFENTEFSGEIPDGSSSEMPNTEELCGNFVNIPECSYAGPSDSQNYKLCKQCYPDR